MAGVMFKDANWIVVRRIAEAEGVAVIPLGSLEQHGPHLPCGTDTFQVNEMIGRALARLPDDAQACVCPTIEYNVVQWASPMASAGISPIHLEQSLVDVCHALTDLGFRKILLVHGHGGIPCGQSAIWQAMQEKRPALYVDFSPFARCAKRLAEICGEPVMHAGCAETSMMLAIRHDLVDMPKAIKGPEDPYKGGFPCPAILGPGCYAIPLLSGTRDGMHGDATRASADIGNRLLEVLANEVARMITEMSTSPLPQEWCSSTKVPLPDA
jgi:creatinine amidohydrolase